MKNRRTVDASTAASTAGGRTRATPCSPSRAQRIIKLDKEVKQASADAIKCVSKAVELFLEGLAVGSHAAMRAAKRKGCSIKI